MEWQKHYIISVCFGERICIINLHTFTHCCIHNFLRHIISYCIICQIWSCTRLHACTYLFISIKVLKLTFILSLCLKIHSLHCTQYVYFVKDTPSNINLWYRRFLFEHSRGIQKRRWHAQTQQTKRQRHKVKYAVHLHGKPITVSPTISHNISCSPLQATLICNSNVITNYNFPNICVSSQFIKSEMKSAPGINCINMAFVVAENKLPTVYNLNTTTFHLCTSSMDIFDWKKAIYVRRYILLPAKWNYLCATYIAIILFVLSNPCQIQTHPKSLFFPSEMEYKKHEMLQFTTKMF